MKATKAKLRLREEKNWRSKRDIQGYQNQVGAHVVYVVGSQC